MADQKTPKKTDIPLTLATVRYWQGQLNGSGIKHDIPSHSSTKKVYLYRLSEFNAWLAGRKLDVRVQDVEGGKITRKTVHKSFKHVEELLYFGEDGNEKEVRKIISTYLSEPPRGAMKRSTRLVMCSAIKSYFDTHDVITNVRINGRSNNAAEYTDEPNLDMTDFYKMMTSGKVNPLTRAVLMVMFQAGLDRSTTADRFNFYAYAQISDHCGTDDHAKWSLDACPIPIKLKRVKTGVKYTTFIDRDTLTAIMDYLAWKESLHGPHDAKGPIFITKRGTPIKIAWITTTFDRIARSAGIQKELEPGVNKIKAHGVRHLLKSTLKSCGCMNYVADHVIGHAPKDPYDQGAKYYPDTLRAEYAKATHKINIFSHVQSIVSDPDPPGKRDEMLESAMAKINELQSRLNELEDAREKASERSEGASEANMALRDLLRKFLDGTGDGDTLSSIRKILDPKK